MRDIPYTVYTEILGDGLIDALVRNLSDDELAEFVQGLDERIADLEWTRRMADWFAAEVKKEEEES